jgi:hypothetical protein
VKAWTFMALLLVAGCKPSVQDLRAQYALEKNKLADRERTLLEFERFNVDLDGQERIQKADVDRVEESYTDSESRRHGPKYEEDLKYVETQRESLASAGRIVKEARAKLVAEVEDQRRRVADAEAKLRQAER